MGVKEVEGRPRGRVGNYGCRSPRECAATWEALSPGTLNRACHAARDDPHPALRHKYSCAQKVCRRFCRPSRLTSPTRGLRGPCGTGADNDCDGSGGVPDRDPA